MIIDNYGDLLVSVWLGCVRMLLCECRLMDMRICCCMTVIDAAGVWTCADYVLAECSYLVIEFGFLLCFSHEDDMLSDSLVLASVFITNLHDCWVP